MSDKLAKNISTIVHCLEFFFFFIWVLCAFVYTEKKIFFFLSISFYFCCFFLFFLVSFILFFFCLLNIPSLFMNVLQKKNASIFFQITWCFFFLRIFAALYSYRWDSYYFFFLSFIFTWIMRFLWSIITQIHVHANLHKCLLMIFLWILQIMALCQNFIYGKVPKVYFYGSASMLLWWILKVPLGICMKNAPYDGATCRKVKW